MALIGSNVIEGNGCAVGHITLERSEKKNALTPGMIGELIEAVEHVGKMEDVGAVLISAKADGSGFCSGFDLKMCHEDEAVLGQLLEGLSKAIGAMRACRMPMVIAASGKGGAIAGGCALLGGADVVVADEHLRLGYPVVTLGISPAVSAPFLSQGIGYGRTRERLLDPTLITARQAMEIGLVHEIVEAQGMAVGDAGLAQRVNQRGLEIAMELAGKPRIGAGATKAWMNELDGSSDEMRRMKGLMVSMGLVGSQEERERLGKMWGGKGK